MIPLRRSRSVADDVDVDRFGVFVPTIMGAGIIMSIAVLVGDAFGKLRGAQRTRRRAAISARAVALDTVAPTGQAPEPGTAGLQRRPVYWGTAAVLIGLGIYGLIGSFWNYWNPDHPWRHIAWIWAVSNLAVLGLLWSGFAVAALARRGPAAGPSARRLLAGTALGRPPEVQGAAPAEPSGQP